MFISLLEIDTGITPGRNWLRDYYHVHQRLCMAFPSIEQKNEDRDFLKPYDPGGFIHVHDVRTENQNFLFRIDPLPARRAMITVQSAIKPDWDYAFHNAGFLLAAPPEVRNYQPLLEEGQSYRFWLTANPTRKIDTKTRPDGTKSNGKRVPVRRDDLPQWLISQGKRRGFDVNSELLDIQTGFVYASAGKSDTPKRFFSARYKGILTVRDADVFGKTLIGGIGSGKGFGFGLLSIAPMKE